MFEEEKASESALERDRNNLKASRFEPESEARFWPWAFQMFRVHSRAASHQVRVWKLGVGAQVEVSGSGFGGRVEGEELSV